LKSCRSSRSWWSSTARSECDALGCDAITRVELPVQVAGSAFGPRFEAAAAVLSARNRVSRRDVVELVGELFGARISAGAVDAILTRTANALEDPYEQLLACVRSSDSLNMDETGWRLKGAQRALWGMFTSQPRRAQPARRSHLPQTLPREQSEDGEKRIQRLLSASITRRLQRRSLFQYLSELLTAHACSDPAPGPRRAIPRSCGWG
jgi:hypothetical protein